MKLTSIAMVIAALVLSGCATPAPVLDLADKTSANVGIVSAQLRQLAVQSDKLYASRAQNVSRLQATNASSRAALAFDKALTEKVGQKADLDLIHDLQDWGKQVDDIFASAAGVEKEKQDAILARQVKIDAKSKALQDVAGKLSTLAAKESVTDRLLMIGSFSSAVRDDVSKGLEDGSGSAAEAKILLDHLKIAIPGAASKLSGR
jgi:outer membrane murein-binding lipoprotein Lpp